MLNDHCHRVSTHLQSINIIIIIITIIIIIIKIPSEQRMIMNISIGVTKIHPVNIYLISDNNFRPFTFWL